MTYNEIKDKFIKDFKFTYEEWADIIEILTSLTESKHQSVYKFSKERKKFTIKTIYDFAKGRSEWTYSIELIPTHIPVSWFSSDETTVDLLTASEVNQIDKKYLTCSNEWWLKTPGTLPGTVTYITKVGSIISGSNICCVDKFIRPCFRIEGLNKKVGEKIIVGNNWATVVLPDIALADYAVCNYLFDIESSDWHTSALKAFIESDEFKRKLMEGNVE